jgi:acetate kinase
MMGTRPGDLDPGLMLFLLETRGLSAQQVNRLVNQESGLLGVSETTSDMRRLLEQETVDDRARDAVDLFCYQARKSLGALVAVLGGLETLVFTGGIGEHAASVRGRICADLEFLGIALDPSRNANNEPVISDDGSRVSVRVMPTREDLVIARHTYRLFGQKGTSHV